jgi:subtilisin family serine protease
MQKIYLSSIVFLALLFISSCKEKNNDSILDPNVPALNKLSGNVGINIVLNTKISQKILTGLSAYGDIIDVINELNAVRLSGKANVIPKIQKLAYVKGVNPDAERKAPPIDAVPVTDFTSGLSTWDLDVINVTDYGTNRVVAQDGTGVIIGVLDTGLLDSWRQYFPEERILSEYAKSFGGGGAAGINVSEQTNKWEHDQDSHGTHVTSTIIGYSLNGTPINGVAPMAKIIPVKVLNQNGSGWSSVIARGIIYIADLKANELAGTPVVINMSLGGSALDVLEEAAIDYAISKGVIIVASAGNEGESGMGYPGAYKPVISVAASGWTGEWLSSSWWLSDVPEYKKSSEYYICDFSSRQLPGQDLDVAAPGSWVVGPYQTQSGTTSYYFLGGTSMASPHVAGVVALMAQENPGLTASEAENRLEQTALKMSAGTATVYNPDGSTSIVSWESDATGAGIVDAEAAL